MKRILLLIAGMVVGALTFAGTQLTDASASGTAASRAVKPTVVLVHGAWADSSASDGVIARLERAGYPVDAFPTPLQGLASDSKVLAAYLATISGPIVLVGHSYGGLSSPMPPPVAHM